MILSFSKKSQKHFLIFRQFSIIFLFFVLFISIILVIILILICNFFIPKRLSIHYLVKNILTKIQLFFRSFRKCNCFEHFLQYIFKFSSNTSWSCKTMNTVKLYSNVLLSVTNSFSWIILFQKLEIWNHIDCNKFTSFFIFYLHILRLCPWYLVISKVPVWNIILIWFRCLSYSAPCWLADDSFNLIQIYIYISK